MSGTKQLLDEYIRLAEEEAENTERELQRARDCVHHTETHSADLLPASIQCALLHDILRERILWKQRLCALKRLMPES